MSLTINVLTIKQYLEVGYKQMTGVKKMHGKLESYSISLPREMYII